MKKVTLVDELYCYTHKKKLQTEFFTSPKVPRVNPLSTDSLACDAVLPILTLWRRLLNNLFKTFIYSDGDDAG